MTVDGSLTKKNSPTIGSFKFGPTKFGSGVSGSQQGIGQSGSSIAAAVAVAAAANAAASVKRPPSGVSHPPPKKQKTDGLRDVTLAEAGKFGSLNEFAFFDKVRKALRSPEVYDNFLRCLVLFNQEVISRPELIQLTTPFLNRHPELFRWFKDFVGHREEGGAGFARAEADPHQPAGTTGLGGNRVKVDPEPANQKRATGDSAIEIGEKSVLRF